MARPLCSDGIPAVDPLDVLVIGGGPCGAAAALTLCRYTEHRVGVFEGTRYEAVRPGETATAELRPLLEYLDAAGAVDCATCSVPAYATEARWGSPLQHVRDTLFSAHGDNIVFDRRRFDETLAALCEDRGCLVVRGAWLRQVEHSTAGWRVTFDGEGSRHSILARQVIDATGRRAAFARRVGETPVVIDRMVAVVDHAELASDAAATRSTLIEAVEDGWWYGTMLPHRRHVVAFMTDADLVARAGMLDVETFRSRLQGSMAVRDRAGAAMSGSTRPRTHPAGCQYLRRPCGSDWIAAGDAAMAVDPLASLGIGHAVAGGIQAARIVENRLRGASEALAQAYPEDVQANLREFLVRRAAVYGAERRWPHAPFWRRRHL